MRLFVMACYSLLGKRTKTQIGVGVTNSLFMRAEPGVGKG